MAKQKTPEEVYEKLTAHKRSRNPAINGKGIEVEEGDNSKFLSMALAIASMPRISIKDPEQVQDRITQYFQIYISNDMKPSVAGLAMALGIDRRNLWKYVNDVEDSHLVKIPRECSDLMKKGYDLLEVLWQDHMQNGKINPASGIFLGKNLYGYKDVVENVVVAENRTDQYSVEDIQKRYLTENLSGGEKSEGGCKPEWGY